MLVAGGAGFFGKAVVASLRARGVETIFTPRKREFDLRDGAAVRRLLAETSTAAASGSAPVDLILHLAAHVGGIGANRAHPAEFFDDNLMLGVQLMHEAWRAGVPKFVAIVTVCAYPKFTPVPFREDALWDDGGRSPALHGPFSTATAAIASVWTLSPR